MCVLLERMRTHARTHACGHGSTGACVPVHELRRDCRRLSSSAHAHVQVDGKRHRVTADAQALLGATMCHSLHNGAL